MFGLPTKPLREPSQTPTKTQHHHKRKRWRKWWLSDVCGQNQPSHHRRLCVHHGGYRLDWEGDNGDLERGQKNVFIERKIS